MTKKHIYSKNFTSAVHWRARGWRPAGVPAVSAWPEPELGCHFPATAEAQYMIIKMLDRVSL